MKQFTRGLTSVLDYDGSHLSVCKILTREFYHSALNLGGLSFKVTITRYNNMPSITELTMRSSFNKLLWTIKPLTDGNGKRIYSAQAQPSYNPIVFLRADTFEEIVTLCAQFVVHHNGYAGLGSFESASNTYVTAVEVDNVGGYETYVELKGIVLLPLSDVRKGIMIKQVLSREGCPIRPSVNWKEIIRHIKDCE